jgi:hypothetical protein
VFPFVLPFLDDRKMAAGGTQPPLGAREFRTPAGVEELKQFGVAQRPGGETATAKLTYNLAIAADELLPGHITRRGRLSATEGPWPTVPYGFRLGWYDQIEAAL